MSECNIAAIKAEMNLKQTIIAEAAKLADNPGEVQHFRNDLNRINVRSYRGDLTNLKFSTQSAADTVLAATRGIPLERIPDIINESTNILTRLARKPANELNEKNSIISNDNLGIQALDDDASRTDLLAVNAELPSRSLRTYCSR